MIIKVFIREARVIEAHIPQLTDSGGKSNRLLGSGEAQFMSIHDPAF